MTTSQKLQKQTFWSPGPSVIAARRKDASEKKGTAAATQTRFEGGQTKTLSLRTDHPSWGADIHTRKMF